MRNWVCDYSEHWVDLNRVVGAKWDEEQCCTFLTLDTGAKIKYYLTWPDIMEFLDLPEDAEIDHDVPDDEDDPDVDEDDDGEDPEPDPGVDLTQGFLKQFDRSPTCTN